VRLHAKAAAIVAAALAVCAASPALPQELGVERSVFRIVVFRQDGADWRAVRSGTGFFVGKDGTALTNAHVVYAAFRQPERFKLLIALDGVFFSADVRCATRLTQDPTTPQQGEARVERDIAQIKARAPDAPFGQWTLRPPGGDPLVIARRHAGPMPEFPALTIGPAPRSGETVRVLGFGDISAVPRRWSTEGTVEDHAHGDDGVRTFSMRFTLPPQPGNSGSPVLNARRQVVGLFTWYYDLDRTMGLAIAGPELQRPCR
jgi:S1-C subfamily serine protease